MAKVSIRRATPSDAHLLSFVATRTFPLACPPSTTQEDIAEFCATQLSPEAFGRYLGNNSYRAWLAMAGNEACGYLLSHDGDPVEEDTSNAISLRPTTEISKIYVSADHHGSPVAQDLLNSALRDASGRGFASAWLGVNQLNARANAFYARNGFVEVGTRSFLVGDTREDDFVREKLLPSQSTGNA